MALIFALVNGEQFQSYYVFYGSLFFCCVYVEPLPLGLRARDRARCCSAAGYRRRAILVGLGASTSTTSPRR